MNVLIFILTVMFICLLVWPVTTITVCLVSWLIVLLVFDPDADELGEWAETEIK